MTNFIYFSIVFLIVLGFVALYRAYKGPQASDRVVAINVITTKAVTIIVLIAVITAQDSYLNVALLYALVGFMTTIGVGKYLMKGKLG